MTPAPEQAKGRPAEGRSFPVSDDWTVTFDAVPRALFLPDLCWAYDMATGTSRAVNRRRSPRAWSEAAGADIAIVTQWDDGRHKGTKPGTVPTSSPPCRPWSHRCSRTSGLRPG